MSRTCVSDGKFAGGNPKSAWLGCLSLTLAALLIHGYHPYAEDAGIYVPAIKKELDPSLYPRVSEFFMLPAHVSIFTRSVVATARLTHLHLPYVLLLWYLACLFFTMVASWRIAEICFEDRSAGFLGATVIAATISMPAAGCALLLSDPYLTSRSVCTALILFSIVHFLRHKLSLAVLCCIAALAFHPLMGLMGSFFLALLAIGRAEKHSRYLAIVLAIFLLCFLIAFERRLSVTEEYRAAVLSRSYFFLTQWKWYELVGAAVPIAVFAWMEWQRRRARCSAAFQISFAGGLFGVLALLAAAAVTWIPTLLPFARLQPMRALQLIYLLFLLLPITAALRIIASRASGMHGKLAVAITLLLVAAGMFEVQRKTFPSSNHVEWPWRTPTNPWQQAFEWVRINTPKGAFFALDPDYPNQSGNDRQLFRAEAERSALPDRAKDGGVAALFPQLASQWKTSTSLAAHLTSLSDHDADELRHAGVTWLVIPADSSAQLDCPYSNQAVSVCRLNERSGPQSLQASTAHR